MLRLVTSFSTKASSVSFQDKDITLSGEHVREGLTCVVSVKVPNPEFEGQTKVAICNYVLMSYA